MDVLTESEIRKIQQSGKVIEIDFDQLPRVIQKKMQKTYDHQKKKHPGITDQQIMEKISKKFNLKFEF